MGFARLTWDLSMPGALAMGMATSQDGKTWTRQFDGAYQRADGSRPAGGPPRSARAAVSRRRRP